MARRVALTAMAVTLVLAPVAGAQVWERAGLGAALLGRWGASAEFLGRVSGAETPAVRYFRGLTLLETGRPGPGLEALEALSRAGVPFSGAALEQVVHWWFRRGAYAQVQAAYRSARGGRFQDSDRLYYEVGQALYLLGDRSGPADLLARVSGGYFLPYALHTRALIAFEAGRLDKAVGLLGDAVDRAGEGAGALADRLRVTRGRVLYQAAVGVGGLNETHRRELLSVARKQFERVEAGSSQYPSALRGIGWSSLELGEPAKALGAFEVAARIDPKGAHEDLWAQGRVYQRSGFFEEALDAYDRARKRALAGAEELEGAGYPSPDRAHPVAETDVRRLLDRAGGLELRQRLVTRALEHRAGRVEAAAQGVAGARAGRLRRLEELDRMSEGLHVYLDGVPMAALVPRDQRGRLERAAALDRRVGAGLAGAAGAVAALESSPHWGEVGSKMYRRLEGLSARLEVADAARIDVRRTFLAGLKARVALREKELAQALAVARTRIASLDREVSEADHRVSRSAAGLEEARVRARALGERLTLTRRRAEDLLAELEAAGARVAAERARRRARRLMLAADAYELDQTQALHLLEGGAGRPAGEGGR